MKTKLLYVTLFLLTICSQSFGYNAYVSNSVDFHFIQTETNKDFTISPNPATSKVNLKLKTLDSKTTLTVYDVLGKKVLSKELDQLNTTLDISRWNRGVYLVRISSENETLTKRFVKQ